MGAAKFRRSGSLTTTLFPEKCLQFLRAECAIKGAADDPERQGPVELAEVNVEIAALVVTAHKFRSTLDYLVAI